MWEEVEARTNEQVELSGVYLAFMVLAGMLAMVGIYQNSAILIVGAMVVGPEFGPLAGLCVALIHRRGRLALRSAVALAVGFPLAIGAVYLTSLLFKAVDLFDDGFSLENHSLANIISQPDFFTFFVAACAGAAGMLSLSTAKSGALIGVLISVTTIPAAANIGLAAAYEDWSNAARQRRAARDQPVLDRARRDRRAVRPAAALPAAQAGGAGHTEEPSEDQISTFVLTFSTTASVNSVVVACPPRSSVLTPPAVVSSVAS